MLLRAIHLSLCFAAVSVAAQQPAAPTFKAATNVVQVDVIVRDSGGEFVRGLTTADFDLREDGRPQRIDFVELVDSSRKGPPAAVPPDAAAAQPTPSPRIFVLMFDDGHLTAGPFKRLQQAATEFLERYFQAGDIGGAVIGGRMTGNRMTTDREELIKAVKGAKPVTELNAIRMDMRRWPRILNDHEALRIMAGDRTVYEAVERRACGEEPGECGRVDIEAQIRSKAAPIAGRARVTAQQTLATIDAVANGLRRFPGRKNVVLLTEGFVADEFMQRLADVTGAAARAGVSLYVLDARGLDRGAQTFLAQNPTGNDGIASALSAIDSSGDAPNFLATATGGMVVRNMNDFSGALRIINDDAGTYYVLAYRPLNATFDGKFRKIDVSVKRPGLGVRARRGYLAAPELPTFVSPPATAAPAPPPSEANAVSGPPSAEATPPAAMPTPVEASPASGAGLSGPRRGPEGLRHDPAAIRVRPAATENVARLAATPVRAADPAGDDLARAGWERYRKGDVEAARIALRQAVQRGPVRPWVHYALGMSEFALAHHREAAAEWERVRAAVPEFQPVHLDLTDAYLQLGELQKSIDVLQAARKRWPGDPEILNALGVIYVRRALLDPAIEVFEKAMSVEPKDGLAYFNAARAYEMRYVKSRRFSDTRKEWVGHDPDRHQAIELYARYLKIGGPFEQSAREALQRLRWDGATK